MIYFLRRSNGDIKIGRTNNLKRRVMWLNSHNKENLEIIGSIREIAFREKELHHRFDFCRVAEEWFRPAPELLAFIDEYVIPPIRTGYVYQPRPRRNANTKEGAGRPRKGRKDTFVRIDSDMARMIYVIAANHRMSAAEVLDDLLKDKIDRLSRASQRLTPAQIEARRNRARVLRQAAAVARRLGISVADALTNHSLST